MSSVCVPLCGLLCVVSDVCLGTVMCYGQTGAGKTFTTTGSTECYQNRGLIPRAILQIFQEVEHRIDYSINIR